MSAVKNQVEGTEKKKRAMGKIKKPAGRKKSKNGMTGRHLKFLSGVAKSKEQRATREELCARLGYIKRTAGGTGGGWLGAVLGHVDPERVAPESLVGKGYLRVVQHEDEEPAYEMTGAGRRYLARVNGK